MNAHLHYLADTRQDTVKLASVWANLSLQKYNTVVNSTPALEEMNITTFAVNICG